MVELILFAVILHERWVQLVCCYLWDPLLLLRLLLHKSSAQPQLQGLSSSQPMVELLDGTVRSLAGSIL